jgi:acyl-CoA hydrolase
MRVISESRLADVMSRLPGVPRVVASGNFATPLRALAVLDGAVAEYRLFALNYFPCRLSLVPSLLTHTLPPDVVLLHTSTPHAGTVSLGTEVNVLPAAIDAVRSRGGVVVAQLNRRVPYTHGDGVLSLDEIDFAIEVDEPLPSPESRTPDETARLIGEQVALLVGDGSTLQLGIGAVPDAALAALTERRWLRVWSEMFSDGVLGLERAGAMHPDFPITASFVFGSAELYEWVDRNPRVRMLRTEKTNDPGLIAKQPGLTSVNSAMQIDLYGQANASRAHGMIYSGFGGQTDFVVGALHSMHGKAIIALPSWHTKSDTSTVVPCLAGPVTSFQHSFIVSEHGVAAIWGQDSSAQAQQIVDNVAHPRARSGLREAAHDFGLHVT